MYAIIETGGKQYRVQEGDVLCVEKLSAKKNDIIELNKVLAVEKDGQLQLEKSELESAKVLLKVVEQGRGRKIIVYKYKPKKNYRRKQGHRQSFTRVIVEKIET